MESLIVLLLTLATVAPLLAFFAILLFGNLMPQRVGAQLSVLAIVAAGVLSFASLALWVSEHPPAMVSHGHDDHAAGHQDHGEAHADEAHGDEAHGDEAHGDEAHGDEAHPAEAAGDEGQADGAGEGDAAAAADGPGAEEDDGPPKPLSDVYYSLGIAGGLSVDISYYIDSLTVAMFAMVTLIASCIHFYALGYMHEEEDETVTDHEVTLDNGSHLRRPGRFHRFFQYLSLFSFSMLGLVLAGNVAMVFVFWELVGICSYFLIGFYIERRSASTAANKAFIVNRVGDFGMIIGLLALWTSLGTFSFGDLEVTDSQGETHTEAGIFSLVRPGADHQLQTPDGMVRLAAHRETDELVRSLGPEADSAAIAAAVDEQIPQWRAQTGLWGRGYGYWLLIVAGVGIFCGCVGKSAQFPLHTWLPDAMEGPTPVSALVHSATMVAAGVYLVARFFPVFAPEVLLVIAVVGCITLFMAATIAITATDIKRVLAYSTISQLGYMMLALGMGGWLAGVMHLITHAFFKSLLFLCSGSVIHAVHTNEMPLMGGLRKKMPITAGTMLIGCLAIAGAGVPFLIGFSGYYSKDMILEQAFSFMSANHGGVGLLFFAAAAGGAAVTSFYMFRLWYMTFAGKPRDPHRYEHAHESPKVMCVPLVILALFAVAVAWHQGEAYLMGWIGLAATVLLGVVWAAQGKLGAAAAHSENGPERSEEHNGHAGSGHGHGFQVTPRTALLTSALFFGGLLCFTAAWQFGPFGTLMLDSLLSQARPEGTLPATAGLLTSVTWPSEADAHFFKTPVTILAFGTALGGFALATFMYGLGYLNPEEVRRQFQPVYRFLVNKWWFDELYDLLFVRPVKAAAGVFAWLDKALLDGLIHWISRAVVWLANFWDRFADRRIVDGLFDTVASWTRSTGLALRAVQTGSLRQYVMFIVVGAVVIFLVISFFWNPVLAG